MKTVLFAAGMLLLPNTVPAFAASPPLAAPAGGYVCEHQGVSRVALRPDPAPCCAGLFACPQLLSNTGLIKPKHSNRT